MKKYFVLASLLFSLNSYALVGLGGYVPFGLSTRDSADGGVSTFAFDPALTLNHVMPFFLGQLFMPEIGHVFHGEGKDGHSKKTIFGLLDFGYQIQTGLVLRYGLGTFLTKISGDGGAVELNNGTSTKTFYRPSKSVTSWNTTLNGGIEWAFNSNYASRFELFMFDFLASTRKFSYILNITYYL
ncbi:MAG: hypothetical protein Fur0010_28600 [Bdellovibrio sp.]